MEAIPCATPRARTNREMPVVTRHGLRSSPAATPLLRRMRQYMLFAKISAIELNVSRRRLPIYTPPGNKSHSSSPRRHQHRVDFAITATNQNSQSP